MSTLVNFADNNGALTWFVDHLFTYDISLTRIYIASLHYRLSFL